MGILKSALAVSAVLLLAVSCSSGSSGGGGPGSCADVSGSWTLSGNCADNACTVTQKDCNITLSCSPSGDVYQGTVSGTSISFGSGPVSCSANVGNKTSSGSCNEPSTGTCQFTGSCSSGACGATGTGSGGSTGSGGASGVDCNSACGSITQCCSGMTFSDCMEGCQTASGQSPACLNCLASSACSSMVPCLIANCNVPSSLCSGDPPEP